MTTAPPARAESRSAWAGKAPSVILTLLTLAAGCVDAVSFLGLGQVLTAAMTGNTVLLGIALGRADMQATLRSATALLGFFVGVLVGASIVERGSGRIGSPATIVALTLELLILVGLGLVWHLFEHASWVEGRLPLIAAAGLAMGIQSAIAQRLGVAGVATTYVTGTLTTLGTRLIGWLRRHVSHCDRVEPPPSWLPAWVWLAYGLGAAYAASTRLWWSPVVLPPAVVRDLRWPSPALALPIVIVATVIVLALGHWARRKQA
jgi:uncharacterized membrane protein YoaK (UPF0700 family)